METKFQTSFIPKKPLVTDPTKSVVVHSGGSISIMMIISIILFIASLGGAVFSVVWIGVLNKAQESYKQQLSESEKRFNISLIGDLKKFSTKIDISKELFKNHLSVSEIFPIIDELTIETVKFDTFEFAESDKSADSIEITMHGVAKNYNSIAFQSDVFGASEKFGKNKIIKNPVVADLSEEENGEINFTFSGLLSSKDILYDKTVDASLNTNQ
jgi:hypothetical protein